VPFKPIQKINETFGRMLKQDVKYRFVMDMSLLKVGFLDSAPAASLCLRQ